MPRSFSVKDKHMNMLVFFIPAIKAITCEKFCRTWVSDISRLSISDDFRIISYLTSYSLPAACNKYQIYQNSSNTLHKLTRAVRGSDYSPAIALSEAKDKLVTENWKDREKKYIQGLYKTTCTSSFHAENIWEVSKQLVQNCKRSCTHKVPTVYTLWWHFM